MLRIGSGSFDPETLVILETAFDEAWITLKTTGSGNRALLCFSAPAGSPVRLGGGAIVGGIMKVTAVPEDAPRV